MPAPKRVTVTSGDLPAPTADIRKYLYALAGFFALGLIGLVIFSIVLVYNAEEDALRREARIVREVERVSCVDVKSCRNFIERLVEKSPSLEGLGIRGPRGPQGPQGETGPQGEQGVPGVPGDTGASGVTGAPGEAGTDGSDGSNGSDGADGQQGDQGDQGIPGVPGVDAPCVPIVNIITC